MQSTKSGHRSQNCCRAVVVGAVWSYEPERLSLSDIVSGEKILSKATIEGSEVELLFLVMFKDIRSPSGTENTGVIIDNDEWPCMFSIHTKECSRSVVVNTIHIVTRALYHSHLVYSRLLG